ncbi:MAG: arginase family protein [Pseudomonadota bacterium]
MPVSLLGFPWDASSSHARGPALGPSIIRSLLRSDASSPYSLSGVDVTRVISAEMFDPLPEDAAAARADITARVGEALAAGRAPLSLGGDHSVTYPILEAVRDKHGPVNVLHIDAHRDLYDEFEGDRYSHASPFARALEAGSIRTLVQVGIRSASPEQEKVAAPHDVIALGAEEAGSVPFDRLTGPLYISIDLDGLDPAFAPGVSHLEPGGLSTREVLAMIKKAPGPLIGADIVELNPERDVNLMTANVAVRLVKELAARLAED